MTSSHSIKSLRNKLKRGNRNQVTDNIKPPKVLAAMSGGVDSAVSALLLMEAGFDVVGATMKLWDGGNESDDGEVPTGSKVCCTADDASDARNVCFSLGINHYVFNFTKDFEKDVIAPFCKSYQIGETPNPCIECNRKLKFGKLLLRARELDCEKIATGHYARIEKTGDRFLLKKAADPRKDQTYVLYNLSQAKLSRTLFPLGNLTKPEVREIAAAHGFIVANKSESQDICFVPDGDYAAFISHHTGQKPQTGDFIDRDGRILGQHKGIIHYTIGQRKGLGVALGYPCFVTAIDPAANRITLGTAGDLFTKIVRLHGINLIAADSLEESVRCTAKTRYNMKETPCTAVQTGADEITLEFDEPVRAVTPGQAGVLYDGDCVIGGGVIL
jgi:tRNA-specific 2-thiouridylase